MESLESDTDEKRASLLSIHSKVHYVIHRFFLMIIIHNARVHIYVASQFPKSQLGLNYIRFPFTVAMVPVCCAL